MTLPVASFTDWTPRTFRIAYREMCLEPAATCFFAQRYKGGEYLLPRSLAMGNRAGLLLATHTPVQNYDNVFNTRLLCSPEHISLESFCAVRLRSRQRMKQPNAISLRPSDDTRVPDYFKYTMRGNVILITYFGASSIVKDIMRILQQIEYWHQGSITSFRILYQDADGIGGEVKWDGEKAEIIAAR